MRKMKRIFLCLTVLLASQLLTGQDYYYDVLKAVSLSGRGQSVEAAAILADRQELNSDAALLVVRGDIYLKAGKIREARSDFMKAGSLQPDAGLYGLARCAAAEGDASTAVSLLEAHLKSPSRKSEPEIMLDKAFSQISDSPEWRALWKKDWYRIYERKSWEIDHYLKSDRAGLAAGVYAELAALYPDMPVTEYCNARILMSQKKFSEAASILESITSAADAPGEWLMSLAAAREGEGSHYAAAAVYERLIRARYPSPDLLMLRAGMLLRSGDRETARTEMLKYIDIDPDNTEALGLMGRTLAEEGAIYEALPYLNRNIEMHPGEASAFRLRGDAWLAARSWERAVEDYTMSLDLDPENGQVNLNLGMALVNSGRSDDACHYLRKARKLGIREATDLLAEHCIR
jgi:tetratricopeptide (TPR) repeat protein